MNRINHPPYPWVSFGILTGIGGFALFLALPRPLKLPSLLISITALGGIVGAGLWLSRRVELKTLAFPLDTIGRYLQPLARSALAGVGLGSIILVVIHFLLPSVMPEIRQRFITEASLAIWKRFVIAFDSAILEELIFRLFLFSLLLWMAGKIWPTQNPPGSARLWAINALIAIGFGIAHLPQWSAITPLTPLVVLSVVFLNSIGGLVFGYQYFTNGLETAMAAHFVADIVLHGIGPVIFRV